MKNYFLSILFICTSLYGFAQIDKTQALAQQYFQTGDYEKAAQLYEELFKTDNENNYYYSSLFNSYLKLNDFNEAEKLVKKQIKKNKTDLNYQIDLGFLYSQNNQAKEAEAVYKEVVNNLTANHTEIRNIANKFISLRQNDFAISTYLKGRELLKDKTLFSYELGNLYLRENKYAEAVATYLDLVNQNPQYKNSVQSVLASNINNEGLQEELETQLYALIQKNPSKIEFPELLIWLYTHQDDYEQALIQAKAIDKRKQEDGSRILSLANNAMQQKQFDAAIDAYKYIQDKGVNNKYFQTAKSLQIKATNLKITTTSNYSTEDINLLVSNYNDYLNSYGKNIQNISSIRELANLEANYVHDINKAIALLEELIALPNLPKKAKNEVKLDLGDFYVLANDVWEATLLYAQVDKDEKDSPLGEDARFRNAKLSYYKGEFEWAQAQLGILKGATSELIANDALKLSIFIMDNLDLDTTTATMQMFADADLLHQQNKSAVAIEKLEELTAKFPGHALADDVLMMKAEIAIENRAYEKAVSYLNGILMNHGEDILADNAAFMLGDLYQNHLNNKEKAMEYYKKIITDYSSSVLLVEARKRFRYLRGDGV